MNWIKKRYDQFLLALFTIALLACAVFIFLRVQSFGEKFSDAVATVAPNNKVPPVKLDEIDAAKEKLQNPPAWTYPTDSKGKPTRGSLFIAEHYIINDAGVPEKPDSTQLYADTLTGQKIPSEWFMKYGLPLLDPKVPFQDPDKDGFTNEDEWREGTDPNNKDSHPPYVTKLFLKKFEKVPFRLVWKGYDGVPTGPKKDPIEKFSFQIDTLDLRQPSEFLKMGDMVPNTKFKLVKFEFKEAFNPKIEEKEDVSELTLVDTITGDKIVLILNKVTDSPDVYANFEYEWTQPAKIIRVKKLQEFVLMPEVDDAHHYKLIDINDTEAQIKLPDGRDYTVKMDPRHK
jgi:hypothetical protein